MIAKNNNLSPHARLRGLRVAVVDGDRTFLDAIVPLLRAEGFAVDTYRSSASAYDGFRRGMPQAIVLSFEMKGSGLELLESIRQVSNIPVLMTSTSDQDLDEALAFRMGADDYIRKPLRERALVERVRAKLRRVRIAQPAKLAPPEAPENTLAFGPLEIHKERAEVTVRGVSIRTTRNEFKILTCLMSRPDVIRSSEVLRGEINDERSSTDPQLAATYVKRIRAKVRAVSPEIDPFTTHYGLGYTMNAALAS